MATNLTIPDAAVRIALDDGRVNPDWYRVLSRLVDLFNQSTEAAEEAVTNADLADMAAWTIKLRNAGTSGDPSDADEGDITEEAAPEAGDFLLGFLASGEIRKFDVGNLSGTVTPIAAAAISGGATEVDIPLGSYDMVEIDLIALEPSDDAAVLDARFSQDNGSSYLSGASDYAWAFVAAGAPVTDASDSEISVGTGTGNAAGERRTQTLRIYRPAASSFAKTMTWYGGGVTSAGVYVENQGWGQLLANTDAITHVRFLWSGGGTFDAGYYAARGYSFT